MTPVKVQTTLVATDLDPLALFYDQDRKWMVQQPLDDATQKAVGTDAKALF